VFVDTSAYCALADAREADDADASTILGRLSDAHYRLYKDPVKS